MVKILFKASLIVLLALSTYTDEKEGKIKNLNILVMMIFGILYFLTSNLSIIEFFIGVFTPLILLIIPFLFHCIGAGDVKLLMAIGTFVASKKILIIIFVAFCLGLIRSLISKKLKKNYKHIHLSLPISLATILWLGGLI